MPRPRRFLTGVLFVCWSPPVAPLIPGLAFAHLLRAQLLPIPTPPVPPKPGVLLSPPPDPRTGSISGVVLDASGKPLSGARVYVNQVPVFRRASRFAPREVVGTPVNINVRTDANGNFTVTALPGGSYVLCAKGTVAEHLLSCQWGAQSTHVAIARAQTLKDVRLSIRSGVLLKVTVDDSLGRVSSFKNLLLGVLDPGVFYARAELASVSGKAATYQLAVPAGRTLHIVTGSRVTLQDSLGRTVLGAQPGFSVTTEPGKEKLVNLMTR